MIGMDLETEQGTDLVWKKDEPCLDSEKNKDVISPLPAILDWTVINEAGKELDTELKWTLCGMGLASK